jgi:general L-amino acid transport system substrate-binding protein
MHWSRINLRNANITLLNSDRPLERPFGLGNPRGYIAFPIGPRMIFLAANAPTLAARIGGGNHSKVARMMNKTVVSQKQSLGRAATQELSTHRANICDSGCIALRRKKLSGYRMKHFATILVLSLVVVSQGAGAQTLKAVKNRGVLNCGSNGTLAGFGLPDANGKWFGLDVDLCRAVAAAIFNDAEKVKFVPLSAKDRFAALQSGEVDLLARDTTWTISRDSSLGLNFTGVSYYDGQAFMVRKALNVNSAFELNGASVCVQQGTTTELNLSDFFRANNMRLKSVTFATANDAVKAYDAGRCDAYSTDASSLYSERLRLANANDHIVLPEVISKEPLGPVVRQGDDQWFDIVKWSLFAMINAEELNITSKNVDEMKALTNPEIKRFVGTEGNYGEQLGLARDWAVSIVKLVGNYGEAFERNVGSGSPLKIDRGLNRLWSKGGIQYAPPIR